MLARPVVNRGSSAWAGALRRAFLLAVIASSGLAAFTAKAAAVQPNVLVIETDDQTVEEMRVMDNVTSLIGDQGATFNNSFVNHSLCCPSRATFLTGQYEHNHGVTTNHAPNGGFDRFESLYANNNLAVWMQDAGYYTGLIGKYLNDYANDPPIPPGWSEWWAAAPDAQKVYDYTLNDNGNLTQYGTDPLDFKQDVLTSKAVDFVDRRAPMEQPFFLWLTYTAPHVAGPDSSSNPPSDCSDAPKPPPRYADSFDSEPLPESPNFNEADVSDKPAGIRKLPLLTSDQIADIQRRYRCELESLLAVDDGVEQVVDALTANGELANTLLIFTSDNGFFHGEHRIPREKQRIYEESIRVPLEMRGPGIPAGETVDDPVINADLAPTIVDAANASPGLVMDGRSLIPVAQQPGIERGRELLIEQPSLKAIRTPRYMYAEWKGGEKELYDLHQDPFELVSLHKDPAYAPVKAALAAQLDQLRNCAGESCLLHVPPISTLGLDFTPSDLPPTAFKGGKLTVHTNTDYANPGNANPGGATKRIQLYLDDDFRFNPSATPTCTPTGGDMASAIAQCGSSRIGGGTAQASANTGLTNGCVLAFNGQPAGGSPTVVLFTRLDVANPGTISCANAAANHEGDTTVILKGQLNDNSTFGNADLVGGKLLDFKSITSVSAFPLTDLNFSIQKGSYIQARCHDSHQELNLQAVFTYNDTTTQTVATTKPCT